MYSHIKHIEDLVRMGLLPAQNIPALKQALLGADKNLFLPDQQRKVLYAFFNKIMDIVSKDPAIGRSMKNHAARMRFESTVHTYVHHLTENTHVKLGKRS